jgi:hypothetical protein
MMKETDEGERAMAEQFRRLLAAVIGSSVVHRRQEQDEQTHDVPLLLLRASISPGSEELNSHCNKSLAASVLCCRRKFDEYGLLFIWVLGPTRRGEGGLHFLSINRTLIRLRSEDF